MAELIFRIDSQRIAKATLPSGETAIDLQAIVSGCQQSGVALASGDYKETGQYRGRELPGGDEVQGPSSIQVIDLPFTPGDIPADWSFGNGVTVGAIRLKDGRVLPCAWVVLPGVSITDPATVGKLRGLFS